MIITEKVRNMNKQEKFKYYLNRYKSDSIGENQKQEAISIISELMSGVPLEDISKEFGVNCYYDLKSTPATMTIRLDEDPEDYGVTFDLNVSDRDAFEGANPEKETRPIKSMLTEEEQQDLFENVDMK